MAEQSLLKRMGISSCGERLDPMLYYCTQLIPELDALDRDASDRLNKDLLKVLKKYRPLFNSEKESSLHVELVDWGKVKN